MRNYTQGVQSLCTAFKFARVDPSPPMVGYSRCILLSNLSLASCGVGLELLQRGGVGQWQPPTASAWDYYFRSNLPPQDESLPVVRAALNITGMPVRAAQLWPEQLKTGVYPGSPIVNAVQTAISARCCATDVRIINITDVSSVTVNVQLEMTASWITDSSPFIAKYIDLALSDAPGTAVLLAEIQRSYPSVTSVAYAALTNTWKSMNDAHVPPPAPVSRPPPRGLVIGFAVALIVMGLVIIFQAALLWIRAPGRQDEWPRQGEHSEVTAATEFEVFLSYRRNDLALADTVVDHLIMSGLRVFYDRSGAMAGKPFEEELHRAVSQSRVTCVLVTLELMQSLVAHRPDSVDWWLAEVFLAVHYLRTRPGRHIFPLLAGPPASSDDIAPQRSYLLTDAAFVAYRDALPDIVPTATLALVTRLLLKDAASGGGELDAALQGITVRQFMLGRPGGALGLQLPLTGLLSIASVSIHGPDDHMGLLLRHRYAERVLQSLAKP
jgi:TIR domain